MNPLHQKWKINEFGRNLEKTLQFAGSLTAKVSDVGAFADLNEENRLTCRGGQGVIQGGSPLGGHNPSVEPFWPRAKATPNRIRRGELPRDEPRKSGGRHREED